MIKYNKIYTKEHITILESMLGLPYSQRNNIPKKLKGLYMLHLYKKNLYEKRYPLFYIGVGNVKDEVKIHAEKLPDKILYCEIYEEDMRYFESQFLNIFSPICINTKDFLNIKIPNKETIFKIGLEIINKKLNLIHCPENISIEEWL